MDIKRYINTRMWSDTWFEELTGEEKLLWLYLLTNQHANLIGIYEIGIKRISNESGIEINRLQTVMKQFANRYKAFHTGKFIVIPNFLKHQTLANPNMEKSAKNIYDSLPEEVLNLLYSIGIEDFDQLKEGLPNRLQTVTKPFANRSAIESESESESESEEGEEGAQNKNFAPSPDGSPPQELTSEVRMSNPNGFNHPPNQEQKKGKKKVAPKKKNKIPELPEFLAYAKEWMDKNAKDYSGKRVQLESKYQSWKDAGWKDGFGNEIKDWKGKIRNVEPHLKSDANTPRNIRYQNAAPIPGAGFGSL